MKQARARQHNQGQRCGGTTELQDHAAESQSNPMHKSQGRKQQERNRSLVADQARYQCGEIFCRSHRTERQHGAVVEPVSPANGKACRTPESAFCVHIEATGLRQHRCQFSEGQRSQQGVNATRDPNGKDQPAVAQLSRYSSRQAQNTDTNCAAKNYRESESQAQDAHQVCARAYESWLQCRRTAPFLPRNSAPSLTGRS